MDAKLNARILRHVDNLAALPGSVVKLMSLDNRVEDYFELVIEAVSSDPALMIRALSLANSAVYTGQGPVSTVGEAVGRVGSSEIVALIIGASVTRILIPSNDWEKSLWRHSLQVGIGARKLAMESKDATINPEIAYTIGMLHDLGRFVMFQEAPEKLRAIDEGNWNEPEQLIQLEQEICGLTHCQLGQKASDQWGLPDLIGTAIAKHHQPRPSPLVDLDDKHAALVQVADMAMFPAYTVTEKQSICVSSDFELQQTVQKYLPRFAQMSLERLRETLRSAQEEAEALADSLGV